MRGGGGGGWGRGGGGRPRFGARCGGWVGVSVLCCRVRGVGEGERAYRAICCSSSWILARLEMFFGFGFGGWGFGMESSWLALVSWREDHRGAVLGGVNGLC